MQRRQITRADGRYLIFYTFDEDAPSAATQTNDTPAQADEHRREPEPHPVAEEEHRV